MYRGADSLSPVGVYLPPGGGKEALHYWTKEVAQFEIFPAGTQAIGVPGTDFSLALFALTQNQGIDVYFNDELVQTKTILPEEVKNWISFSVKVNWRSGSNVVKLVGHGTPAIRPDGDPRPSLFAVLDPRRLRNNDGSVTAQPGVAQAKD